MKPETNNEASEAGLPERSLFGVFVTAKLKGEIYPLQGSIISESPLRIKCSGGDEYECEGTPAVVINPPDRTPASMVCVCENPGPHMKPGAGGKFCAVCGWDIPPNAERIRGDADAGKQTGRLSPSDDSACSDSSGGELREINRQIFWLKIRCATMALTAIAMIALIWWMVLSPPPMTGVQFWLGILTGFAGSRADTWLAGKCRPNVYVDLPDTAAQDSASKTNSPAVSG